MTTMIKIQRARLYTQKAKELRNFFIYKKPDTFQKARQFPSRFYIQKAIHFTLRDFSWNFWSWHLYTKSMTLCVTWRFYIKKARYFAKSKTVCDTFYIQKSGTFALRDFSLNFWNLRRGGAFIYQKNNVLCVTFLYCKNNALCVALLCKKGLTLCFTFEYPKKYIFLYVLVYIIYCVLLIHKYKGTYN